LLENKCHTAAASAATTTAPSKTCSILLVFIMLLWAFWVLEGAAQRSDAIKIDMGNWEGVLT